jgi:hypothetical protein
MARSEPPLDPPDEDEIPYWDEEAIVADLAEKKNPLFLERLAEEVALALEGNPALLRACSAMDSSSRHDVPLVGADIVRLIYGKAREVATEMRELGHWVEPDAPVDFEPDYDMEARCYG